MDTIFWETTLSKCFCLPCEKGSTLKEKSKFFPFTIDSFRENLFPEGDCSAGKQTENYKSWHFCKNGRKSTIKVDGHVERVGGILASPASC